MKLLKVGTPVKIKIIKYFGIKKGTEGVIKKVDDRDIDDFPYSIKFKGRGGLLWLKRNEFTVVKSKKKGR